MTTVSELVAIAMDRADLFTAAAYDAISSIDARKGAIGYATTAVDPSEFSATYTAPAADTTPFPTYQTPSGTIPTAPTLVSLGTITAPTLPTAPTISTTGLFGQVLPSGVIPDWNEAAPDLKVDEIYNDLVATALPILADVDIPSISPISIATAPTLQLPDYEAYPTPEAIPAVSDYATYYKDTYDASLPEMKAFVDDVVSGWIARYAPEYEEQRMKINEKLIAAMDGEVLPAAYETALYARARAKAETEYKGAEKSVLEDSAKRGFVVPPGATKSALDKLRMETVKSLAGQATEIYIKKKEIEVQHLQFVLNLVASQLSSVRSLAMQYAQTGLGMIQQANAQADAITQKLMTMFEHERSRHEFSLAIMKALNEQYEVKLKAALSGLEGYKLELQAIELKTNVEMKAIDAAKTKLEAQQLQVARYSAIIDAIAKRAAVDELKIKEYGIRADVFKVNIQARLAAFDAYKAAIEGDKAKLQGELAKLEVYNSQLKAADLQVGVQANILEANVKTNLAYINQYGVQLDAYKTSAQVALQQFTQQAELKKLGLDVYKTNVQANLEVYKGELEKNIAQVNSRLEAFKGNVASLTSFYGLQQKYTELDLTKTTAIASGYTNVASATLQSMNSTISQVASE